MVNTCKTLAFVVTFLAYFGNYLTTLVLLIVDIKNKRNIDNTQIICSIITILNCLVLMFFIFRKLETIVRNKIAIYVFGFVVYSLTLFSIMLSQFADDSIKNIVLFHTLILSIMNTSFLVYDIGKNCEPRQIVNNELTHLIIDKQTECSICLENLEKEIVRTSCNHLYHKKCIEEWLRHKNSCPICRKVLVNN